jgi:ligand-binding sensor domain-containing protein
VPAVRNLPVRDKDVLVLVGTVKGAFLARRRGRGWDVGGPYFAGQSVYAMAYDARAGRHRIWAATESGHFGSVLRSSDDFGRRW